MRSVYYIKRTEMRRTAVKCIAGLAAAMLPAADAFTAHLAIRTLRSPCAVSGLRMQAVADDTRAAHSASVVQCSIVRLLAGVGERSLLICSHSAARSLSTRIPAAEEPPQMSQNGGVRLGMKTLMATATLQYLNVLSAAAELVGEMPEEMVEAAKQGKLYEFSSLLTVCNSRPHTLEGKIIPTLLNWLQDKHGSISNQ